MPQSLTEVTEVPGTGMEILRNLHKFRVEVRKCYRTHRCSRYLWHWRTELTEVPGMYQNAVRVPRIFVARAYRTYRSSVYGYECPTELTEVPGTGMNIYISCRSSLRGNTAGNYPGYGSIRTLQNTTLHFFFDVIIDYRAILS